MTRPLLETIFYRPLSRRLAGILGRTPITPNAVTWAGFVLRLAAVALIRLVHPEIVRWAAPLLILAFLLDCTDGDLARLRNQSSPFGAWLDAILDRISEIVLFFSLAAAMQLQGYPFGIEMALVAYFPLALTHLVAQQTALVWGPGTTRDLVTRKSRWAFLGYLRPGEDLHLTVFAVACAFDRLSLVPAFFLTVQLFYVILSTIIVYHQRRRPCMHSS